MCRGRWILHRFNIVGLQGALSYLEMFGGQEFGTYILRHVQGRQLQLGEAALGWCGGERWVSGLIRISPKLPHSAKSS